MITKLKSFLSDDIKKWISYQEKRHHQSSRICLSDRDILGYDPYPQQKAWVEWAYDEQHREKLFLGARRYGKSDLIVVYGVVQSLIKNPEKTFLIMCRTEGRAMDMVSAIAESLKKSGFQGSFGRKKIFLNVPFKKNKKQPTVSAITVLGRTKGHHADVLILDDPVDPLDENLESIKNRVRKVYYESGNIAQSIIIIGQYVSEDDLYVELEGQIDTLTAWHGTIPELDRDREEFLKTRTIREWGLNYGGFLMTDQSICPLKDIQTIHSQPSGSLLGFIDPSFKGNDYTALSIGWMERRLFIVRGYVFKSSWFRCLDDLITLTQGCDRVYYEGNGVGDALYLHTEGFFRPHHNRIPKISRISRIEGLVHSGLLRISRESHPEYLRQIRSWSPLRTSHYDDAPDSLSSLVTLSGIFS